MVMSIVVRFGEKAAVSQLSWSYHAIGVEMRGTKRRVRNVIEWADEVPVKALQGDAWV
jgi:hypothetical protein